MTHSVLVTCPNCQHTHTVDVDDGDLLRPNDPAERQFDLKDLERILGLSRITLKRAIYRGDLIATKTSSGPTAQWFVSASELQRYRTLRNNRPRRP